MSVAFACPACGFILDIPEDQVGKEISCSQCQEQFVVPVVAYRAPVPAGGGAPGGGNVPPRAGKRFPGIVGSAASNAAVSGDGASKMPPDFDLSTPSRGGVQGSETPSSPAGAPSSPVESAQSGGTPGATPSMYPGEALPGSPVTPSPSQEAAGSPGSMPSSAAASPSEPASPQTAHGGAPSAASSYMKSGVTAPAPTYGAAGGRAVTPPQGTPGRILPIAPRYGAASPGPVPVKPPLPPSSRATGKAFPSAKRSTPSRPNLPCTQCGEPNSPHTVRCRKCGALLLGGAVSQQAFKRPFAITMMALQNILSAALYIMMIFAYRSLESELVEIAGVPVSMSAYYAVLFVAALFCAVSGFGLWNMRPWGRLLQVIGCVIGLLAFPIGTLFSIPFLLYLHKQEIKVLFSDVNANHFSPQEKVSIERGARGSTLFTILVTIPVVILGLGLVGLPTLLVVAKHEDNLQRERQEETITALYTIVQGLDKYNQAYGVYPGGTTSVNDLEETLQAYHEGVLPEQDGWGEPFELVVARDGSGYEITSRGKNGQRDENLQTGFNADFVVRDGRFVEWPEEVALPEGAVGIRKGSALEALYRNRDRNRLNGAGGDTGETPIPKNHEVAFKDLGAYIGQPLEFKLKTGPRVQAILKKVDARSATVEQYLYSGAMTYPIPKDNIVRIKTLRK